MRYESKQQEEDAAPDAQTVSVQSGSTVFVKGWSYQLQAVMRRVLGWFAVIVAGTLVFDMLWLVASRDLVGNPSPWADELATLLMVWLAMIGAALAYLDHSHLGLQFVSDKLTGKVSIWVTAFQHVVVLFFAVFLMVYGGGVLTQERYAAGQLLPALGISKAWFYVAIPISGLCWVVASLTFLVQVVRGDFKGDGVGDVGVGDVAAEVVQQSIPKQEKP